MHGDGDDYRSRNDEDDAELELHLDGEGSVSVLRQYGGEKHVVSLSGFGSVFVKQGGLVIQGLWKTTAGTSDEI